MRSNEVLGSRTRCWDKSRPCCKTGSLGSPQLVCKLLRRFFLQQCMGVGMRHLWSLGESELEPNLDHLRPWKARRGDSAASCLPEHRVYLCPGKAIRRFSLLIVLYFNFRLLIMLFRSGWARGECNTSSSFGQILPLVGIGWEVGNRPSTSSSLLFSYQTRDDYHILLLSMPLLLFLDFVPVHQICRSIGWGCGHSSCCCYASAVGPVGMGK